jgi:hypothetical protein
VLDAVCEGNSASAIYLPRATEGATEELLCVLSCLMASLLDSVLHDMHCSLLGMLPSTPTVTPFKHRYTQPFAIHAMS